MEETKESFSAEGHVTRFYFKSRSDDYHVALFVYNDKQAIISGNLYSAEEKERIFVKGEWYVHQKYGRQVRVDTWERIVPTTEEQAIAFLSSSLIKGVGPVTAKRIVEKLGAEAVKNIMEKGVEALAGIKGLRKPQEVYESVRGAYEAQRIVSQLLPLGISVNAAMKAHKKFGGATAELVKRNPYCLMEVDSIGFLKADAIAQGLGVSLDSTGRIAGAIRQSLKEIIWDNGYCYATREELLGKALKLLNHKKKCVTREQVDNMLKHLSSSDRLVIEDNAVYTPKLYKDEVLLAESARSMLKPRKDVILPEKVERLVKQYELREGIRLSSEQKQVVVSLMNNNLLILTGGPGVGKTTAVKAVISVYESLFGKPVLLASPTGKASRRLAEVTGRGASTVHRLLGFRPGAPTPAYCRSSPLPCGLLVVDEVSMMGVSMAKMLFDAVGEDTRVLLVGDADQLPSVEPGNVLADLLAAGVPAVRLEKVFRQASQSQIVTGAHAINKGKVFYPDHGRGDFYFIEKSEPEEITRTIVGCVMRFLKLGYSLDDIQVLSPMKNGPVGTITLNRMLQERLNPSSKAGGREITCGDAVFRVGDRVICVRNNYEKGEYGVFNGETGIISRVIENENGEAAGITVYFEHQGDVEFGKSELHNLELAYAITAHKSQGSEFKAVVIPLTTSHYIMLNRKLIYTAVSRAKEKVVLVGTKKAYWIAVRNNKLSARNTKLRDRIENSGIWLQNQVAEN
ncbi:MAG TPA: ATP-dependent RecD-like DNA helicase [Bacillota bacterium]|nr:ATP-dependent RecD-like DNA helicase [Bacillota bacterium]